MATWWTSLSTVMQVLWAITLSASLIFVIQTIMTFLGIGGDDGGADIDVHGDVDFSGGDGDFSADPSMNLLTFRNLVNFFLGFGWTAVLLEKSVDSMGVLLLVSFLVGVALVAFMVFMFKWLYGMQQSGTIDVNKSAAGCTGSVYLTIPADRSGRGKVQIVINESVREYDAVTDGEELKSGTPVRVVDVEGDSTLVVEAFNPSII